MSLTLPDASVALTFPDAVNPYDHDKPFAQH